MVLRGDAALPQADEPEAGDAAVGEEVELFVGDLVEAVDVAAVFFGELLEPDVGALGHEDDVGHPGLVGGEGFVLVERGLVVGGVAAAADAVGLVMYSSSKPMNSSPTKPMRAPGGCAVAELVGAGGVEAHPDGEVFFAEDVDGEEDAAEVFAEVGRPVFADEVELAGEGVGRGEHGRAEGVEEAAESGRDGRAGARSSWGRRR